jgi:hypothetical protein
MMVAAARAANAQPARFARCPRASPVRRAARARRAATTDAGARAAPALRVRHATPGNADRAGPTASCWCPHPTWASWESRWPAVIQTAAAEHAPGWTTSARAEAPARTAHAALRARRTARARHVGTTDVAARAAYVLGHRPASMGRAAHHSVPDASAEATVAAVAAAYVREDRSARSTSASAKPTRGIDTDRVPYRTDFQRHPMNRVLAIAWVASVLGGCGTSRGLVATEAGMSETAKGDGAQTEGAVDAGNDNSTFEDAGVTDSEGQDALRGALVCGDASCAEDQFCIHTACPGGPPGGPSCSTPPPPQCIDVPDGCAPVSCACPTLQEVCGAGGCGTIRGAVVYCVPSQ